MTEHALELGQWKQRKLSCDRTRFLELGQWKQRKLSCDGIRFGVRTMETVEIEL